MLHLVLELLLICTSRCAVVCTGSQQQQQSARSRTFLISAAAAARRSWRARLDKGRHYANELCLPRRDLCQEERQVAGGDQARRQEQTTRQLPPTLDAGPRRSLRGQKEERKVLEPERSPVEHHKQTA